MFLTQSVYASTADDMDKKSLTGSQDITWPVVQAVAVLLNASQPISDVLCVSFTVFYWIYFEQFLSEMEQIHYEFAEKVLKVLLVSVSICLIKTWN